MTTIKQMVLNSSADMVIWDIFARIYSTRCAYLYSSIPVVTDVLHASLRHKCYLKTRVITINLEIPMLNRIKCGLRYQRWQCHSLRVTFITPRKITFQRRKIFGFFRVFFGFFEHTTVQSAVHISKCNCFQAAGQTVQLEWIKYKYS